MTFSLPLTAQQEISADVPVDLGRTRQPQYGRYLDELEPGQVFEHPRGFTFERSNMLDFARTFMQTNPLYLNLQYARAHGFPDLPASPQMVFNVTLSLGVQNDSEKAIANLGYYQVQLLRPVYPGDTLRAFTKVLERRDRGPDKPGIARIRTVGVNQDDAVVVQYERKIMVAWRGDRLPTTPAPDVAVDFPGESSPVLELPLAGTDFATGLTGTLSPTGTASGTLDLSSIGSAANGVKLWFLVLTLDNTAPDGIKTITDPHIIKAEGM